MEPFEWIQQTLEDHPIDNSTVNNQEIPLETTSNPNPGCRTLSPINQLFDQVQAMILTKELQEMQESDVSSTFGQVNFMSQPTPNSLNLNGRTTSDQTISTEYQDVSSPESTACDVPIGRRRSMGQIVLNHVPMEGRIRSQSVDKSFDSPRRTSTTVEKPLDKLERRKQVNREAAQRLRQRKKMEQEQLVKACQDLAIENAQLREILIKLQGVVKE